MTSPFEAEITALLRQHERLRCLAVNLRRNSTRTRGSIIFHALTVLLLLRSALHVGPRAP